MNAFLHSVIHACCSACGTEASAFGKNRSKIPVALDRIYAQTGTRTECTTANSMLRFLDTEVWVHRRRRRASARLQNAPHTVSAVHAGERSDAADTATARRGPLRRGCVASRLREPLRCGASWRAGAFRSTAPVTSSAAATRRGSRTAARRSSAAAAASASPPAPPPPAAAPRRASSLAAGGHAGAPVRRPRAATPSGRASAALGTTVVPAPRWRAAAASGSAYATLSDSAASSLDASAFLRLTDPGCVLGRRRGMSPWRARQEVAIRAAARREAEGQHGEEGTAAPNGLLLRVLCWCSPAGVQTCLLARHPCTCAPSWKEAAAPAAPPATPTGATPPTSQPALYGAPHADAHPCNRLTSSMW